MKKLFLFLVVVLALVSVSEPAKAKKYCEQDCYTYYSWGKVCKVCQEVCEDIRDDGTTFVTYGPPVTTCYSTVPQ